MRRRVAAGRLHRKFPGVFAVGHEGLSREGVWLAAVDACGRGAVLSHLAAACLWGLLAWNDRWLVDVTVGSGKRAKRGVRIQRSKTLATGDVTSRQGIPVTNVPRLIADLRRTVAPDTYRRVLREAEYLGFRRGLPPGYVPTRSEFEEVVLRFCATHGFPMPVPGARIGPFVADFLFPAEKVFVEADGWTAHGGRSAFEADHERDLYLKALGYEVVRLTWRQVIDDPGGTAAALRTILRRRAADPSGDGARE